MAEMSRIQLVLCVIGAAVVVVLGIGRLGGGEAAPDRAGASAPPSLRLESTERERVVVHVAGAVHRPGVYRVRASARVDDAVRRAGGPTRRADLGGLNLAAQVEDGRQILVPERASAGDTAATATGLGGAAAAAPSGPAAPVNLNTATLEQLDVLPGIGPAMAQRILDHREANGGFGTVEELTDVPGIAEGRMAALRELVTV
jgi:competence protein ComEA